MFANCLFILGNEIPELFGKQKDLPLGDDEVSITVDIPYYCHSSERRGIVACLLVEPFMTSANLKGKTPLKYSHVCFSVVDGGRFGNLIEYLGDEVLNCRHLAIMYISDNMDLNCDCGCVALWYHITVAGCFATTIL